MKTCSKCGKRKSFSEFYTREDSKDGYRGQCKSCVRDMAFRRHSSHPLTECVCGCGELIPSIDRWGKERHYVNGHYRRGRGGTWDVTGDKNPQWKGGRIIDKDGYVYVQATDHPNANAAGYVFEHRLVAERMLGRLLRDNEVAHHRNGVPDDNKLENLEVMTVSEHISLHNRIRWARMKASDPDVRIGRGESHGR